jgi:ABC-type Mn2+/Zn2+ transport system permease subunit
VSLVAGGYAQRALVEVVLVGVLCGVVGVHVVLRRLSFFTMSMTHATFPGVVVAAMLGMNLYLGGGAFGVLLVLAVSWLWSRPGMDQASVVGVVLSGGFALGVALLSAQSGFSRDLTAYLTGSILTVTGTDLFVAAGVAFGIGLLLALAHKELLFTAFDRDGARAAGYPVAAVDVLMLLAIEAVVVATVPAAGTILTLALVVAPAGAVRLWTARIGPMTAAATVVAVLCAVGGLQLSRTFDVAAGGAISLLAAAAFGVSAVLSAIRRRVVPRWNAAVPRWNASPVSNT